MDRSLTQALDEDDDDHLVGGRIVGWYRVDPTRRLGRALASGAAVMTLGSVVMALAFARLGHAAIDFYAQESLLLAFAIGGLGLGTIVGGGVLAIVGLRGVLAEERYLALRTDGAYLRDGARREILLWADVAEVRAEGRAVVFERHDGTTWLRDEAFAGIDATALARHAADVRGKALFGLL